MNISNERQTFLDWKTDAWTVRNGNFTLILSFNTSHSHVWIAKVEREREGGEEEHKTLRRREYIAREEFHDLQIVRLGFRDLVPTFETPPWCTKVAASLEKIRDTYRTLSSSSSSPSLSSSRSAELSRPSSKLSALDPNNPSLASNCTSKKTFSIRPTNFLEVQRDMAEWMQRIRREFRFAQNGTRICSRVELWSISNG